MGYHPPIPAKPAANQNTCTDELATRALSWILNVSTGSGSVCSDIDKQICSKFFSPTGEWHSHNSSSINTLPTDAEKWGWGLLFTLLVCSCASFGACFYPLMKKDFFNDVLTWMVAMGVGCLSGISIFHLIPQCFEIASETPEDVHAYLHKAVVIMSAIYLFYLAERLFKIMLEHRQTAPTRHEPNIAEPLSGSELAEERRRSSLHLQQLHVPRYHSVETLPNVPAQNKNGDENRETESDAMVQLEQRDERPVPKLVKAKSHSHSHHHHNHHHHHHGASQALPSIAWMILTGDALHKFVDGLSIGAAFSVSTLRGISISVAVFCEELPHELGDMAILINSGLSLRRAVTYNCLTGISCILGFCIGVMLGDLHTASSWIFAVAGGMFLYISLVNMVPEMIAVVEEAGKDSTKKGLIVLFVQNTGFVFGIALMYILARYAHQIEF